MNNPAASGRGYSLFRKQQFLFAAVSCGEINPQGKIKKWN